MAWDSEPQNERVAVLESELTQVKKDLQDIRETTEQILSELTRYKGFLGGITFIISGVLLSWQLFGEWIKRNL